MWKRNNKARFAFISSQLSPGFCVNRYQMHLNLLISFLKIYFLQSTRNKAQFWGRKKRKTLLCLYRNIWTLFSRVIFSHYDPQKLQNAAVEMNCTRQLKEICDNKPMWKTHYFYMHISKVFIKLVGSKTFVFPQVIEFTRMPKAIQGWAGEERCAAGVRQQEQLLGHQSTAVPSGASSSWGGVRLPRKLQAIRGN